MQLQLKRPICFRFWNLLVSHHEDRIVEIYLKAFPDGSEKEKTWLVNPKCLFQQRRTAAYGITNEKVADAPTFKKVSAEIYSWFGSDLAGYNSDRFDILFAEEKPCRNRCWF